MPILKNAIAALILVSCLFSATHLRIRKEGGWGQLKTIDVRGKTPIKSSTITLQGTRVTTKRFDYSQESELDVVLDLPLVQTPLADQLSLRDLKLAIREITTYASKNRLFGYKVDGVEILSGSSGPSGYGPQHTVFFVDDSGDGQFNVLIEWPSIGFQLAVPDWAK